MTESLLTLSQSIEIAKRILAKRVKLFIGSIYLVIALYSFLYFLITLTATTFAIMMTPIFIASVIVSTLAFKKAKLSMETLTRLEKIKGNEIEEGLRLAVYFLITLNIFTTIFFIPDVTRSLLLTSLAEIWIIYIIKGLNIRNKYTDFISIVSPIAIISSNLCDWSALGFSLIWGIIGFKMVTDSWQKK
ncbi:hypothetical protein [Sulfuracidifex metallicus]|uniref:hypothetical protein n=1 Tax=Sulfuracidifex metallicus TaxID=47303 RepID=UPI0022723451|nr:hypothetical protein [Sulfuracidifex metallicus]MCY0850383.1 hypothetical protein [Sulfuracidifex metallicus]